VCSTTCSIYPHPADYISIFIRRSAHILSLSLSSTQQQLIVPWTHSNTGTAGRAQETNRSTFFSRRRLSTKWNGKARGKHFHPSEREREILPAIINGKRGREREREKRRLSILHDDNTIDIQSGSLFLFSLETFYFLFIYFSRLFFRAHHKFIVGRDRTA